MSKIQQPKNTFHINRLINIKSTMSLFLPQNLQVQVFNNTTKTTFFLYSFSDSFVFFYVNTHLNHLHHHHCQCLYLLIFKSHLQYLLLMGRLYLTGSFLFNFRIFIIMSINMSFINIIVTIQDMSYIFI